MTNIWEFLLTTLTCSLTALLLLILKKIFFYKLSPRWQYGIWVLLALRILLPVAVHNRYIILPLPQWIENIKFIVESKLSSSYSEAFNPISEPWFLPHVSATPVSITDWLFIIYIAGVIITLLSYIVSYVRLRLFILKGTALNTEDAFHIDEICRQYGLKNCPAVELDGLTSAFICGIAKPILVLPKGTVTDDKVILHEMLHLHYRDALQSVCWSLLNALNWCNPFMRYIFHTIANDMEALCDQRVLERIEGEERREYGKILLSMANDSYPCAFGTTSVSNGGKNIAKRITCIANFKKYPRGMALVSVCIAIVLLQPLFTGNTVYSVSNSIQNNSSANTIGNLQSDMASTRLNRCTTVAGAVDTFAKGLIYSNGLYLAASLPLDAQEELYNEMLANILDGENESESPLYYYIDNGLNAGSPIASSDYSSVFYNGYYALYNLRESAENTDSKNAFDGELVILLNDIQHTEDEISEGSPVYYQVNGEYVPAIAIYNITISQEDQFWVISRCSEPEIKISEYPQITNSFIYNCVQPLTTYTDEGLNGTITAPVHTRYIIDNQVTVQGNNQTWYLGTDYNYTDTPVTNAKFKFVDLSFSTTYTFNGDQDDLKRISYVTLESKILESDEDIPKDINESLGDGEDVPINIDGSGASTSGWGYNAQTFKSQNWSGTITDYDIGITYYYEDSILDILQENSLPYLEVPKILLNRIYIDGLETDLIISKEVDGDGTRIAQ